MIYIPRFAGERRRFECYTRLGFQRVLGTREREIFPLQSVKINITFPLSFLAAFILGAPDFFSNRVYPPKFSGADYI